MSKVSKACDISPSVRRIVRDRDKDRCIICGSHQGLQIAHYISRGRLGLGIPENLAVMCIRCHGAYDNGKYHSEIKELFSDYLRAYYPDWDESKITYSKWR